MVRNYTVIDNEKQWATEIKEREPGYVEFSYQVVPATGKPWPKSERPLFKRIGVMTDGIVFADHAPQVSMNDDVPSWKRKPAQHFEFRGSNDDLASGIRELYASIGKKSELTEDEAQRVREFIDTSIAQLDMQQVRERKAAGRG